MKKDLIISYYLTCPAQEAEAEAEATALEQSVELPRQAVKDPQLAGLIIPDILELMPLLDLPNGLTKHRLRLGFSSGLVGEDILQFFNLLFGNVSFRKGLLVENVDLPKEILDLFPGPSYGIAGIRDLLGYPSRALLCCVLKPTGSSADALAAMAGEFARAGVPFIKDDHGLSDQSYCPFAERVKAVQMAIRRARSKSIYLPNITGPIQQIEEKIAMAFNEGIKGFLVSPFLIGLDTFRYLRNKYPVLWMAHPAFSGTFFKDKQHGFRPGLLLGLFLRLLGADMVIFPDAGGRFLFTPDECKDIAQGLRFAYEGRFKPAMPVPAGGISISGAARVREFYGSDVMPLIGGAILLQKEGLEKTTHRLLEVLRQPTLDKITGEETGPRETPTSYLNGNYPPSPPPPLPKGITRQIMEGVWEGRERSPYKREGSHFSKMTRIDLYVPTDQEAGFDVRYFEIEPGGYSSFEKHRHIHLVIGARGKGELRTGNIWQSLTPDSIAFIPQNCPHQLRNQGTEVFGFYCIVDHVRDHSIELTEGENTRAD